MFVARRFNWVGRSCARAADWCLDRAAAITARAFRWPLVVVVSGAVTWGAYAAPPAPGSEDWEILHPHGDWIRSLQANGMLCCDWSDTRPVKVRTNGDGWQVWLRPGQIEGAPVETWLDVPPEAVIRGPNPVGVAIASYWGGKVRCFVPPGAIRMSKAVAERRAEILRRFGNQARPIVVAREMGIDYQTARNDLLALGYEKKGSGPRKGNRHHGSKEFYSAVLRAVQVEPSRSLESFGQQFGVTRERIRQIIKLAGLPPKPHTRRHSKLREEREAKRAARKVERNHKLATVLALRQRGMTYREIGEALNIGTMTAYHRVIHAKAEGITVSAA